MQALQPDLQQGMTDPSKMQALQPDLQSGMTDPSKTQKGKTIVFWMTESGILQEQRVMNERSISEHAADALQWLITLYSVSISYLQSILLTKHYLNELNEICFDFIVITSACIWKSVPCLSFTNVCSNYIFSKRIDCRMCQTYVTILISPFLSIPPARTVKAQPVDLFNCSMVDVKTSPNVSIELQENRS
jgi:hypothetical protein